MDGALDPQVAHRVAAVEAEIQQLKMQQLQEEQAMAAMVQASQVSSPSGQLAHFFS